MKLSHMAFSALLLLGTASYANHDKAFCTCDTQCQESCAEGKGENCECKTCDCAKSGKCDHGKCEHHHGKGHKAPKGGKASKVKADAKADTSAEANTNAKEAAKE